MAKLKIRYLLVIRNELSFGMLSNPVVEPIKATKKREIKSNSKKSLIKTSKKRVKVMGSESL